MKNNKKYNSLIDPEEIYHQEAPESWIVHAFWLLPGIFLLGYIIGHAIIAV